jgi:hypothetical protein
MNLINSVQIIMQLLIIYKYGIIAFFLCLDIYIFYYLNFTLILILYIKFIKILLYNFMILKKYNY